MRIEGRLIISLSSSLSVLFLLFSYPLLLIVSVFIEAILPYPHCILITSSHKIKLEESTTDEAVGM